MGTVRADSIGNLAGTKSATTDQVVDGIAKAWVNFNGTGTIAIRKALNVSSITDNGAGDYTVNLTSSMPDANYCVQCSIKTTNNFGSSPIILNLYYNSSPTTANFRLQCQGASSFGPNDSDYVMATVYD